jgi:hypothetical protein
MSTENKNELIDKIKNWLHEQNYQFNVVQDDATCLNLSFWSNPEIKLNVIIMNDSVEITTIMSFTPEGVKRLSTIDVETRKTFEQDLRMSLLPIEADHEFVYNNEIFVGVKVYKVIFFDGLNKTKFFDTISTILHSTGVISIKYMQLIVTK